MMTFNLKLIQLKEIVSFAIQLAFIFKYLIYSNLSFPNKLL